MSTRTEKDSLGSVAVPADRYWGAQTERSRQHFRIGPPASMPQEIIRAYAHVKQAAAATNHELGRLDRTRAELIIAVCREILDGALDEHFPLVVWQTGSGTQTNMNVNEVIANRAHVLAGGRLTDATKTLHPNDDVNMSQSSNDTFPSAMHVAAYSVSTEHVLPAIAELRDACAAKARDFAPVVKVGRTHCMDAAPIALGQAFGAFRQQLDNAIGSITRALEGVAELALGATAVGTGMNAPPGFATAAVARIAATTGLPFICAANRFEAIATHDALVELHGAYRRTAVSLMKIANDVIMLASGPRCGIGELQLPENEPGSSIMPGKVNPTQAEAMTMVAAQVMGNDAAVAIGGSGGHFELNVFKPLIAANVLASARLLGDACMSFSRHCVIGIEPRIDVIERHLENSLMSALALNPHIGYAKAAEIAHAAYTAGTTLREAALATGTVNAADFDRWTDPRRMIGDDAPGEG